MPGAWWSKGDVPKNPQKPTEMATETQTRMLLKMGSMIGVLAEIPKVLQEHQALEVRVRGWEAFVGGVSKAEASALIVVLSRVKERVMGAIREKKSWEGL